MDLCPCLRLQLVDFNSWVTVKYVAWPHQLYRSGFESGPECEVRPGTYAIRLISWTVSEGSTVSSLICDCWLTRKLATFMGSTILWSVRLSQHDVRLRLQVTYSEPLSRGLARGGGAAAQAGRMSRCAVLLHCLGREHNVGLKSFNQYPSPRPLTPQRGETCRLTLPIHVGMPAEGRHTYIHYTT